MRHKLLTSWVLVSALPVLAAGCVSAKNQPAFVPKQSWTEKVGASVKGGTAKLAAAVKPKPDADESGTLNPTKKPGPGVYVALGEMHEKSGNLEEAETQLRKALALDANHLGALLAYAHLEDRRKNYQAAIKYYHKATKKHPDAATAHNDLGLCYHRNGKLDEASKSLATAVELEPHKKLYRDNLAAVLVDQGKPQEALVQLSAAHGEGVGNYNLAYLLVQKRDNRAALYHFQRAAQVEPTLAAAHQWVAQLSQTGPPVAMVANRTPYGAPAYPTTAPPQYPQTQSAAPANYYPTTSGPQPGGQLQSSRRYQSPPTATP